MPKLARYRAKHESPQTAGGPAEAFLLHVDMDAFFVSVELLEKRELRGRAVIVGGQKDQRGVVSAASYEARRYGVHSAMPLRTAARLCPQAVFLDARPELYARWSDCVAAILAEYSPVVEMTSIDEAYLDLEGTQRLHGPPLAAAHTLHREIRERTGLPCSMGLAATRLVAKIASDQAKPNGLLWVPAGSEQGFLAPLPARKVPGIGRVTEAALRGLGIETVGQLAEVSQGRLEEVFGQWGNALYRKARGLDAFEFFVDAEPKSISHNRTFGEDTCEAELLHSTLSLLAQKVAKRLRESGLHARTITLTIRYKGFDTYTRSQTLPEATELDTVIARIALQLLDKHWDGRPVRLLGVALSQFAPGSAQLDLLEGKRREQLERLARATDRLRDRFGFSKIQLGSSLRRKEED